MGREVLLTEALTAVMDQRCADAAAMACAAAPVHGSVAHSIAAFAYVLDSNFGAAAQAAARARTLAAESHDVALAAAASGFVAAAVGEEAAGASCDGLPDSVVGVLVVDRLSAFTRYLAVEAALSAARLDLIPSLVTVERPEDWWRDHDFAAIMTICGARAAAFSGQVGAAAQILATYEGRANGLPGAIVGATAALIAGNAGDSSALARQVEETLALVEDGEIEPTGYIGRGLHLLLSYGLVALGDKLGAAHALLRAGGDAALSSMVLVDRAIGFEVLVAAALDRDDADAAEAWLEQARELQTYRAAAPAVARAESRVALARGRADEAIAHGRRAEQLAAAEARILEAAEAGILVSQALIAAGAVSEASLLLNDVASTGDASGHHAVRRAASRVLRTGGRRLKPVQGAGWETLSAREREVAAMLLSGMETEEVARELVLSPATVRVHVSRVLAAFGVASRIGLVAATSPRPLQARDLASLTARQSEVAALVAMGNTNAVIAETLGISAKAVENHVSEIRRRLGATSRFGIAHVWWAAQAS